MQLLKTVTLKIIETMILVFFFSPYLYKEILFIIGLRKTTSKDAVLFLLYVTDIGNTVCQEIDRRS